MNKTGQVKIGFRKIIGSSGSLKTKFIKLLDFSLGRLLAAILPSPRPRQTPEKFRRLLIIRPGGIGDAIFLLPILKHIRQKDPELIIDILCEKRNAEVFLSQPQLNIHVYRHGTLWEFGTVLNSNYDIVIDTEQWHYFSAIAAYIIISKLTVGFASRPFRKKLFNKSVIYDIDAHEFDNFKALFSGFWGDMSYLRDINSSYEMSAQSKDWATAQVPEATACVFLGASIPERRLTHEQNISLVQGLLQMNLTVALLGGKDVQEASHRIEQQIKDARIKNFVGKISLRKSAALISRSQVFIGADSGLMHLACAIGTKTIALFGPGNLRKWEPKGEKHSIITENVDCSPCTQFGYTVPTCKGSYHCMRHIKIERVLNSVR